MSRSTAVTIRELERGDVEAVAAIEAAVNPSPWSAGLFAGELALAACSRHWLVACVGSQVVGFGGVMYAADTAHLMNLGVAPAHQQSGIGLRLCRELLAETGPRGATGFTLEVRESNHKARRLYERLGMTVEGVRPNYYPDGEDAVILWLHDLASSTPTRTPISAPTPTPSPRTGYRNGRPSSQIGTRFGVGAGEDGVGPGLKQEEVES